jgi:hypothetical protein
MIKIIGYCKECESKVFDCDELADYKGIYECPICCHPHTKDELLDKKPSYIKNK